MEEEKEVNTTEDDPSTYKILYKFGIAGVQHHHIKDVLATLKEGDYLSLRAEPTNKFDPNAIRIEYTNLRDQDDMLGYVPKKISAEVSAKLSLGKVLDCVLIKLDKTAKPWEMTEVEIREVT